MIVWMEEIGIFRNEPKLRARLRQHMVRESPGVSISNDIAVINTSCNCLFNKIQRYVGLRLVFSISRDTWVLPSLSVAFTFLWTFVVCVVVTGTLFGQEQAHPKWPGEVIGILPLARSGERAVNCNLTVVEFASRPTSLMSDADAFVS